MKNFINKIHYAKDLKPYQLLIKLFLAFGTIFYAIAINLRNTLYFLRILPTIKVNRPVIAIGNLTTGGTGKTPITAEIARLCAKSGKKTTIISRGYGGKLSSQEVHLVADGENVFLTAQEAGDEPFWLASNLKGVSVVISKDRVKAAQWAIKELNSEVLILDDGFQYRRLYRDLNILLVDGQKKFGNEMLLPAGPLREPLSQAKRANKIIVVNKTPQEAESVKTCRAYARHLIKVYDKETFGCNIIAAGVQSVANKVPMFDPKKVYAFTGIAQPESFFKSILAYGHTLVKKIEFNDHHAYTEEDLNKIVEDAKTNGAEAIITTEKDLVKIKSFIEANPPEIPVFVLRLSIEMDIASLLKGTIEY